jgi:hypothetical protein
MRRFCAVACGVLAVALFISPRALALTYSWSVSGGSAQALPVTSCKGQDAGPGPSDTGWWDQPLRAFRFQNANGDYRVQVNIGQHSANYRFIGKDLDHLFREKDLTAANGFSATNAEVRPCGSDVVYTGFNHYYDIPDYFRNWQWLGAPYYEPNGVPGFPRGRVYGFLHDEFHGSDAGGNPPLYQTYCGGVRDFLDCYRAAITLVTSDGSETPGAVNDLGATYKDPLSPQLVASIPIKYYDHWATERVGYRGFTNIIKKDGSYYMLAAVRPPDDPDPLWKAQVTGTCVLRTDSLGTTPWKAYAGRRGWIQLVNPYPLEPADPTQDVCRPVVPPTLNGATFGGPRSLTYNQYLHKYMVLGQVGNVGPPESGSDDVWYALSDDLVNWSSPQPLITRTGTGCGQEDVQYPVVLDATNDPAAQWHVGDADPNFDHPSRQPYLYFDHEAYASSGSCGQTTAELARAPIKLEQRQADLDDATKFIDSDHGFDSASSGFFFQTSGGPGSSGYGDGSTRYAQAQMYGQYTAPPTATPPHGVQAVAWHNTDDVWYGGAFFLQPGFTSSNGNTDIMRWDSTLGSYGGIGLRADDGKFHLVTGGVGPEGRLGAAFDLPQNRWVWVEVHQVLSGSAGGALNEVYVDGRLVASSTAANLPLGGTVNTLRHGFVSVDPWTIRTSYAWMLVDRTSVLAAERGPMRGSADYRAPDTPTGLDADPTQTTRTHLTVTADTVPAATGYRLYRLQPVQGSVFGTWTLVDTQASPSFDQSGLSCSSKYTYRITTYRQATGTSSDMDKTESVASTPVDLYTASC